MRATVFCLGHRLSKQQDMLKIWHVPLPLWLLAYGKK